MGTVSKDNEEIGGGACAISSDTETNSHYCGENLGRELFKKRNSTDGKVRENFSVQNSETIWLDLSKIY